MSETVLLANFGEYRQTGNESLKSKKYNSAANEFFKAFITLCDIAIYRKLKLLPDSHEDRFRILRTNFPEIYRADVSLFDVYRRTYKLRLSREEVKLLQDGVAELAKKLGIKEDL